MILPILLALLGLSHVARAHQAAWVKGMYCLNGVGETGKQEGDNTNAPVNPLYDLPKSKWWFQADRGCDKEPPADGAFLELPAGGSFTVEIAQNRAFTTLGWGGRQATNWPDGGQHPDDWHGPGEPNCLIESGGGAMHTNSESGAAGTVFAISYNSDISRVTMENLVVFSVLPNTPWRRIATYQVPAGLPPCPAAGCTCAWGWVPKGCGQANMYMAGYKCKVTGSQSKKRLAPAKAPKYCANNRNDCVKGAKQIIAYQQKDGNNVVKPSNDFVAYDANWGYLPGAQNDIFR